MNEYAVYGQLAINNMQYFSFNHLFVEVDAINKQTGMMASSISKASLIQRLCNLLKVLQLYVWQSIWQKNHL